LAQKPKVPDDTATTQTYYVITSANH